MEYDKQHDVSHLSAQYQPIEDDGVIGDGYTAVVGESGSIDERCFSSCFMRCMKFLF